MLFTCLQICDECIQTTHRGEFAHGLCFARCMVFSKTVQGITECFVKKKLSSSWRTSVSAPTSKSHQLSNEVTRIGIAAIQHILPQWPNMSLPSLSLRSSHSLISKPHSLSHSSSVRAEVSGALPIASILSSRLRATGDSPEWGESSAKRGEQMHLIHQPLPPLSLKRSVSWRLKLNGVIRTVLCSSGTLSAPPRLVPRGFVRFFFFPHLH